jgi:TolB-like protein
MTPDIFLSYTREDQATAQRFAEAFEGQGFSVWWDAALRSGEAYDQVTEEALRTAKAVVVLWSKKSVVSRWVRAEATLADRNRTLVPAMIEPCERPIMFELTQTADLCRWAGAAADPAWRAFLADVRRFVEAESASQAPAPRPSPREAPRQPSDEARPSIAVLPFINRSGREEDDAFADCMVEDLTAALSGSPWMKVVASSATAIYRQGARELRQIGCDLGARYLLEGNVRRVGADLRVTTQLVEAETSNILWTQKFDRPLQELSELQEELAAELARHLRVQVERAARERALGKPGDVTAWEALSRALGYFSRATLADLELAVAEAERAVDIDPGYGHGYGALSAIQSKLLTYRGDDPELAQAIAGNVRRARALDPNNVSVLIGISAALSALGKLQDALPLAQRALAIYPDLENTRILLASILVRLGRSDEALAELDAVERLPSISWLVWFSALWRSVVHLQCGRIEAALEAAQLSVRLSASTESLAQLMLCSGWVNDWDAACEALGRLQDLDPQVNCGHIENLLRDFYRAAEAKDEFVAIVGKTWKLTSEGAAAP